MSPGVSFSCRPIATVSLSNLHTIHRLRERELMLHPGLPLSLGAALTRTEAGLCADLTVQPEAGVRIPEAETGGDRSAAKLKHQPW